MVLGGIYLRAGEHPDAASARRLHAVSEALRGSAPPGVTDVVPSYTSVFIEFDRRRARAASVVAWARSIAQEADVEREPRHVRIPARYDGVDLEDVAVRTGLSPQEVVARHAEPTYTVFALGFTAGFPFLGPVDPALRLPRRATPRGDVPAHSVAIAQDQTGVYPVRSPGGWHLLGHALVAMYDPTRERPFLLEPGDAVTFEPAQGAVPAEPEPLELLPTEPRFPVLRLVEAGLCDLVVDGGRLGVGRYGLARSGPLDAWTAAQANRFAGNRPDAGVLELNAGGPVVEVLREVTLGFAGWGLEPVVNGYGAKAFGALALRRGDRLTFRPLPTGVRAYLALPGGIDSAAFMGSVSVDVRARIGRPLRPDDILGAADDPALPRRIDRHLPTGRPPGRSRDPLVLRITRGPQATDVALAALVRDAFVVGGGDRMGLRLSGHTVPGGEIRSEATPAGAIQVTAGGDPIVLLADRGTLGGYAKPAILDPRDLPRAGQLRTGQRVAFRLVDDAPYPEGRL